MQTMYESVKIGIIGGDMRQIALARRLGDMGYECAVFGLPDNADVGKAVKCRDWKSAVEMSSALILPLPALRDGIYINMPFAENCALPISHLIDCISVDTVLIGGKFDSSVKSAASDRGICIFDYNDREEFQIKNAVPTAEGAIEIAMHELPITLHDANVMILGYGRIGKVIFSMLHGYCSDVVVAARKASDIAYVEAFGGCATTFCGEDFARIAENTDVFFNTVPAEVLPKNILRKLKKSCLIIDLASGKGGTDFDFAKKCNIKAVHALALPGKVAPVTAGNIICDLILTFFAEERGDMKL